MSVLKDVERNSIVMLLLHKVNPFINNIPFLLLNTRLLLYLYLKLDRS